MPAAPKRPDLKVVDRPEKTRRWWPIFAASALLAVLVIVGFAAVAMHAQLARNQMVLDQNRAAVVAADRLNQRLRVEMAELGAPQRIIEAAFALGMESPDEVTFLPTPQRDAEGTSSASSADSSIAPVAIDAASVARTGDAVDHDPVASPTPDGLSSLGGDVHP